MAYADIKTKKDKVLYVYQMISSDTRWLMKALLTIYDRQTAEEQATQTTKVHNHVGFTGCDGTTLSSFAEQLQRKGGIQVIGADINTVFSPKQQILLKRKMVKYAKQLVDIAEHQPNTQTGGQ